MAIIDNLGLDDNMSIFQKSTIGSDRAFHK